MMILVLDRLRKTEFTEYWLDNRGDIYLEFTGRSHITKDMFEVIYKNFQGKTVSDYKEEKMIPKNITRDHVLEAAKIIDQKGIPKNRKSTKYNALISGRKYPPKYVIAVASKLASGKMINAQSYNGGQESNSFLRTRGFSITEKNGKIIGYP